MFGKFRSGRRGEAGLTTMTLHATSPKHTGSSTPSFEGCGLRITPTELMEVEGAKVMVRLRRDEVLRVAFCHGIQAPRPMLQFFAGAILLPTAYLPARHLIDWVKHGGTFFTVELWLVTTAVLGL